MPEYSVRSLTSPGPRAGSSYSLTETSLGPSNVTTRPTDGSSLFDGPGGEAPDEEALEGEEEEHDGEDHDQAPSRRELVLLRPAAGEQVEPRGQHPVISPRQVEQRHDEHVPGLEEDQHREDRDAGAREREHDAPEDLELARAVNPGGVGELLGQVHVEGPHEKDAYGQAVAAGARDQDEDDAELRAEQARVAELVEE